MLNKFPIISITFLQVLPKKIKKTIVKSKKNTLILPWPWEQEHNLPFSNSTRGYWRLNKVSENKQSKWSNSIPTKILELFKKEFSKPLSHIINLSFNQGVFPNLLKIEIVIPFTKKVTSLIVITTDLFLFYLTLVKFLRNVCTLV